ncbi:MAG TPA: hypothetical protein VE078_10970, partial [Thermoanaerobaculia bacterium]|nr:hypothetical protein [Thermoanaerobaculia bacterium]
MLDLPLDRFCAFLAREEIRRFWLVWDEESSAVLSSHPALEPLARFLQEDRRDYDRHEGVFA